MDLAEGDELLDVKHCRTGDDIILVTERGQSARFGVDVTHHARAELVGRERELSVLRDAFDRARHERIPQLVTLVAVPGLGKSRLVYELSRIVDADPELITWRQGRCRGTHA